MRPWCAGEWALGRVLVVLSFEVYLAVHLGMVRSPALSAGVGVGNLGPAVGMGGAGLQESPVAYICLTPVLAAM